MQKKLWPVQMLILILLLVTTPVQALEPTAAIELIVDASHITRRIIHSQMTVPVNPGRTTFYYPKWIPGEHGPTGPIVELAGLIMKADQKVLLWQRDEQDMYTIYYTIPEGIHSVQIEFDFLLEASSPGDFTSGGSVTPQLAVINWNQVLLYPQGPSIADLRYRTLLTLPQGWKFGTALPVESIQGSQIKFTPVSVEKLIDSPLLCGRYFREEKIGPADAPPHFINLAADSATALELDVQWLTNMDHLVREAGALFGSWPYTSYRFLVALSDFIAHFGLEHHESSDNRVGEAAMIDDSLRLSWMGSSLLPHEFVHAWNGKFRRPLDMLSDDYQQPQRTKLLWVYEELTQYLMFVLTARSGFWTLEQSREYLAITAEMLQNQRGRTWRTLEDTAVAAQILFGSGTHWSAWRRSVDFYDEGILIWLEVDCIIRKESKGTLSLKDFCHQFFGTQGTSALVKPYVLEDIITILSQLAAYDWHTFFKQKIKLINDDTLLSGLDQSGWRLVYKDKPSAMQKIFEKGEKGNNLTSSLGVEINELGIVQDIIPGKAADLAGIAPGMQIIAVNSRRWSPEILSQALSQTTTSEQLLELLIEDCGFFKTYSLNYHGGEKHPWLERDSAKPDLLSEILHPLTSQN